MVQRGTMMERDGIEWDGTPERGDEIAQESEALDGQTQSWRAWLQRDREAFADIPVAVEWLEKAYRESNPYRWPPELCDRFVLTLIALGYKVNRRDAARAICACGFTTDEYMKISLPTAVKLLEARMRAKQEIDNEGRFRSRWRDEEEMARTLRQRIGFLGGRGPSRLAGIDGKKVRALVKSLRVTNYERTAELIGISKDTLDRAFKGEMTQATFELIARFATSSGKSISLDQLK